MKSVKAGSMGSKMAKIAGIIDKAGDILKAAGGKIKQWTLNKLPKAIKGIFGKGAKVAKSIDEMINESKSAFRRALNEKAKLQPPSKYKNKAIASDSIKSVSGWTDTDGFSKIKPSEVKKYSDEIGHTPKNGGASDYAGKDTGFDGKYNSSHAEKKILSENPNEPIGVTEPMCKDCQEFCSKQAKSTGEPVVVTDPECTRVFHPDGRIEKF